MVRKKNRESAWLMDEASSSQNLLRCSRKSVTPTVILTLILISHVYVLVQEASLMTRTPSPPGSAVKGKKRERPKVRGRNEVKRWIKIDTDGWSGLRCFLKTALVLGSKPPAVLPPTDTQPAAWGWDGSQYINLSVFFLKCHYVGLTTAWVKLQIESTQTGRQQHLRTGKDKSLTIWVAFQCPDVFYISQLCTGCYTERHIFSAVTRKSCFQWSFLIAHLLFHQCQIKAAPGNWCQEKIGRKICHIRCVEEIHFHSQHQHFILGQRAEFMGCLLRGKGRFSLFLSLEWLGSHFIVKNTRTYFKKQANRCSYSHTVVLKCA